MNIDYSNLQNKINNLVIKKAPKTFFQILNKPYNEVLVSKVLAYFLNERNTTREILKQILTITAKDEEENYVDLLEFASFEGVQVEETISDHSRLDIIIKYSTFWIVIENKILAEESKKNQTIDYEKQLKALKTDDVLVKYIYLKPYFNKSKASNSNFVELLYDDLIEILESVKEDDLSDKDNYFYLQDFIKHSKEFFMKKDNLIIDDSALNFYLENKEKLNYILQNFKQQSQKLKHFLVESIEKAFPTFKIFCNKNYMQIYKDNWGNDNKKGIHFEILLNGVDFDMLLDEKDVKSKFLIHNESDTNKKYINVQKQLLSTKSFSFDNENKDKSIRNIVQEMKKHIENHTKEIDEQIVKADKN